MNRKETTFDVTTPGLLWVDVIFASAAFFRQAQNTEAGLLPAFFDFANCAAVW